MGLKLKQNRANQTKEGREKRKMSFDMKNVNQESEVSYGSK